MAEQPKPKPRGHKRIPDIFSRIRSSSGEKVAEREKRSLFPSP